MRNEIRHAIRALSRDRGFAAMVVLSLAVGIGANTAIFSLVNGVLLRPPAYRDPDRLVAIDQIIPKFAKLYPALPINLAILLEWRKQATSLESIGVVRPNAVNLTGAGEPELVSGARVSANIFAVLGIQPRLGGPSWKVRIRVGMTVSPSWPIPCGGAGFIPTPPSWAARSCSTAVPTRWSACCLHRSVIP